MHPGLGPCPWMPSVTPFMLAWVDCRVCSDSATSPREWNTLTPWIIFQVSGFHCQRYPPSLSRRLSHHQGGGLSNRIFAITWRGSVCAAPEAHDWIWRTSCWRLGYVRHDQGPIYGIGGAHSRDRENSDKEVDSGYLGIVRLELWLGKSLSCVWRYNTYLGSQRSPNNIWALPGQIFMHGKNSEVNQ